MRGEELEVYVRKARQLTYGMFHRTGRLPDYADFRAAFQEVDQRPLSSGTTEQPTAKLDQQRTDFWQQP